MYNKEKWNAKDIEKYNKEMKKHTSNDDNCKESTRF